MSIRPIFISVEGCDGSGKTTAISVILQAFRDLGVSMIDTREPGGSAAGDLLRDIVKSKECAVSARTRLLIMLAARCDHLEKTVLPALRVGTSVLTDRYRDSTEVFQGHLDGLKKEIDIIEGLPTYSDLGKDPDYTIFLDIDETAYKQRLQARGADYLDVLWQGQLPYQVYRDYFKQQKFASDRAIIIVDATKTVEEVHEKLRGVVGNIVQNERMRGFLRLVAPVHQ